jgi:hypothetical protein
MFRDMGETMYCVCFDSSMEAVQLRREASLTG